MSKLKDHTGKKFHMLTALKFIETKKGFSHWLFRCDCGNEKVIRLNNITHGTTKSCGCLQSKENISKRSTKHGMHGTRIYTIYHSMIQRCNNPKNDMYHLYGGRGIKVCNEWSNSFESFRDWALSNGYKDALTIDREDSDGNYEPFNCRWATPKEQAINRKTSIMIEFNGISDTLKGWSDRLNINHSTLGYRYHKKRLRPPELFITPKSRS